MRTLIVVLLSLVAATAVADPSKQDKDKAQAHYKQGKAFYDQAQWQSAIDEYEKAWKIIPQPLLQFNIGLAYERQGNLEEALVRYKTYLELDPKGAVADEAREYVATLTPKVEAARAEAARIKAEDEARQKAEADRIKKEEDDRRKQEEADRLEAERIQQEEADRQRKAAAMAAERDAARSKARLFTWSGIGAGVVGVACLGVGVMFGLQAKSASDDLEGHTSGAWTDELLAKQDAGRRADLEMKIFTVAGGVTAITGAALFFLGRRANERADRLAFVPGPGAGIGVAGSF